GKTVLVTLSKRGSHLAGVRQSQGDGEELPPAAQAGFASISNKYWGRPQTETPLYARGKSRQASLHARIGPPGSNDAACVVGVRFRIEQRRRLRLHLFVDAFSSKLRPLMRP